MIYELRQSIHLHNLFSFIWRWYFCIFAILGFYRVLRNAYSIFINIFDLFSGL